MLALDAPDLDAPALTKAAGSTPLHTVHVGGPTPDLLDPDGHLRAAYGTTPTVFLIRPDGYIAVAAPPEEATAAIGNALEAYASGARVAV